MVPPLGSISGPLPADPFALAADVPRPRDLFQGVCPAAPAVPHNLLVFTRRTRAELQDHARWPHQHHRHVLIINLGTAGLVGLEGAVVPFHPGEALLVFPHQAHYYPHLAEDSLRWIFLTFAAPGLVPQASPLAFRPVALEGRARDLLVPLLEELRRTGNEPAAEAAPAALLLGALLECLAAAAGREAQPRAASKGRGDFAHQRLFGQIARLVHQRLIQPFTIKELAGRAGLSESHLRALFRRQSGLSLGRYLLQVRLARATGLLRQTNLPVGRVAEASGFDSIYSFSRSFRHALGVSPRAYRRQFAAGGKPEERGPG